MKCQTRIGLQTIASP